MNNDLYKLIAKIKDCHAATIEFLTQHGEYNEQAPFPRIANELHIFLNKHKNIVKDIELFQDAQKKTQEAYSALISLNLYNSDFNNHDGEILAGNVFKTLIKLEGNLK